ncbi:MAG: ParB N-terminal domain-containing protein, partial [Spirochaetales bacterium]|nr:ParB N-terminal domain-containing protein [Spirochaetales bacterium]
MAKFSNNNLSTIKIPLEQIREESGNVRKEYDWQEIENLAKSIQANGLLNPLTVKPGVIEPGLGKNAGQTHVKFFCFKSLNSYL